MHRIKKLLAASSAAIAVTGGVLALAAPANAAPSLSVTLDASGTGASAYFNAAGDPVLTPGSSSGTFARLTINNVPAAAPTSTTVPTFTTDNYTGGSPRFFIDFQSGDELLGYPAQAGGGPNNWQVIPAATGPCKVTEPAPNTYAASLAFITGSSCGATVTMAGVIADPGQAAGTTDTITGVSYNGATLPVVADAVTVTSPGAQSGSVGIAINSLTLKAASNDSNKITAWAATGLPTGLAINTTTGAITGTPTANGTYAVTVTATDQAGVKGSASFTWIIGGGPVATYSGNIRLFKMGLCLDDRLNSGKNGAVVQVWRCKGDSNQVWQVVSDGTIRHNGLCLDATGFGTAAGTKVQLWTCSGKANQRWDTSAWRVHYDNTGAVHQVLDDTGFGGPGTQQEIWTNNGGNNQQWATF